MISLELAQKLKVAGLEWEPKQGDWGFVLGSEMPRLCPVGYGEKVEPGIDDIWLPRLDQLLAEIKARGWEADSVQHKGKYACDIAYLSDTVHTKYQTFDGDTREDACAHAYLWILEQAKGA